MGVFKTHKVSILLGLQSVRFQNLQGAHFQNLQDADTVIALALSFVRSCLCSTMAPFCTPQFFTTGNRDPAAYRKVYVVLQGAQRGIFGTWFVMPSGGVLVSLISSQEFDLAERRRSPRFRL